MTNLAEFFGPNAGYVLDLYSHYLTDPNSVDAETRAQFEQWTPAEVAALPQTSTARGGTAAAAPTPLDVAKIVGAARVTRLVRELGHLTAHIDPLGGDPPGDPGLDIATHGLQTQDLAALPASVVGGPLAEGAPNALEALGRLRRAYSGTIGYEDDHVQNADEREWLREAAETRRFFDNIPDTYKRNMLWRLTEVEGFEQFLQKTFGPAKRFSIEGTDMLVPMLDTIIEEAAQAGTSEVVMGMAHRGRLNVLAHILGKPYAAILEEFQYAHVEDDGDVSAGNTQGYSGDVKYHLGARRAYKEDGVHEMPVTLAPNPSHLEFVDPIVVGRARAAQEKRDKPGPPIQDPTASLAIQIHGDAAFPGQGIVAETLNMSRLPGYSIGGSIHIIANNQIGFTTLPSDDRSTLYASDLAKGFEIPIAHVNADDPVACIAVARMALAYRERFDKDFLIDLVGYRRYGHNEGDNPGFTQPRMYEIVSKHPTVRQIFARQLEQQGVVTRDEADAMVNDVQETLRKARTAQAGHTIGKSAGASSGAAASDTIQQVDAARLRRLNDEMLARPESFTTNAKLKEILGRRLTGMDEPNGIDWAHAEALAFASILEDGTPIRLTGQDTQRGTFGVRHSVLHDPTSGATYTPLQNLPDANASFAVYNSPLSENAALGFEYGYSIHATEALVLWEAQFGDFSNGAQVIIDQFLVSGNAKWQQTPSLVLLLPHGYEGAGPEHSSARLERYLQLAANENIQVINCTSSAQYFHALRRQAAQLQTFPRPLIVMTPKSLLRHPKAGSSLSDLAEGTFQKVIDDPAARERANQVTRLIFCSGKVYIDLVGSKTFGTDARLAAARLEQLYPFPSQEIQQVVAGYPNLREVVWLQEEPRNMGAWRYLSTRMREIVSPSIEVVYIGRPESASPAEGSGPRHTIEQNRIVQAAQEHLPAVLAAQSRKLNGSQNGHRAGGVPDKSTTTKSLSKRSGATHAR